MRKYLFNLWTNVQSSLTYRGQSLIWLVGNTLSLMVMVFVWLAANGSGVYGGYTKSELITYYILSLFVQWTAGWFPFYSLQDSIKNGSIVGGILVKPVSLYWTYLSAEAGWRIFNVAIGIVSFSIFALIFRNYFVVNLEFDRLLLALLALPIAILVTFSFSLCLGMLGFWFTEIGTLDALFWVGRGFLGGQGIPVSFVPNAFQLVILLSPFRYMFSFPLEIYFGKLSQLQEIQGFLIGTIWIFLLYRLYLVMWNQGRKAYTSFGN